MDVQTDDPDDSQLQVGDEVVVPPFWGYIGGEDESRTSFLGFSGFTTPCHSVHDGSYPESICDLTELTHHTQMMPFYSGGEDILGQFGDSAASAGEFFVQSQSSTTEHAVVPDWSENTRQQLHSDHCIYSVPGSGSNGETVKNVGPGRGCSKAKQKAEKKNNGSKPRTKKTRASSTTSKARFILNTMERKKQCMLGLRVIFAKVKLMEDRTGALAIVKALYESQVYTAEDVDEYLNAAGTRGRNSAALLETYDPTSEELEDDHRYAATMLTQKQSPMTLHDHQYNEISTSSGNKRMKKAWYQVQGSPRGGRETDPSECGKSTALRPFIKHKFERERAFCQFLETIYSKISRLEIQTRAKIEMTVTYESHHFNAENYITADSVLRKLRILKPRLARVDNTVTRLPGDPITGLPGTMVIRFQAQTPTFAFQGPSPCGSTSGQSATNISNSMNVLASNGLIPNPGGHQFDLDNSIESNADQSSPADIQVETDESTRRTEIDSTSQPANPTPTQTEPICIKCNRHSSQHQDPRKKIFWIRCADPLCQYLVHASCLGFYASHAGDLRRLPQFYCPEHRDFDFD